MTTTRYRSEVRQHGLACKEPRGRCWCQPPADSSHYFESAALDDDVLQLAILAARDLPAVCPTCRQPVPGASLVADLAACVVWRDGRQLALTDLEWRLVASLASRPGAWVHGDRVIHEVWSGESRARLHDQRRLSELLRRTRKILGDDVIERRPLWLRWLGEVRA